MIRLKEDGHIILFFQFSFTYQQENKYSREGQKMKKFMILALIGSIAISGCTAASYGTVKMDGEPYSLKSKGEIEINVGGFTNSQIHFGAGYQKYNGSIYYDVASKKPGAIVSYDFIGVGTQGICLSGLCFWDYLSFGPLQFFPALEFSPVAAMLPPAVKLIMKSPQVFDCMSPETLVLSTAEETFFDTVKQVPDFFNNILIKPIKAIFHNNNEPANLAISDYAQESHFLRKSSLQNSLKGREAGMNIYERMSFLYSGLDRNEVEKLLAVSYNHSGGNGYSRLMLISSWLYQRMTFSNELKAGSRKKQILIFKRDEALYASFTTALADIPSDTIEDTVGRIRDDFNRLVSKLLNAKDSDLESQKKLLFSLHVLVNLLNGITNSQTVAAIGKLTASDGRLTESSTDGSVVHLKLKELEISAMIVVELLYAEAYSEMDMALATYTLEALSPKAEPIFAPILTAAVNRTFEADQCKFVRASYNSLKNKNWGMCQNDDYKNLVTPLITYTAQRVRKDKKLLDRCGPMANAL